MAASLLTSDVTGMHPISFALLACLCLVLIHCDTVSTDDEPETRVIAPVPIAELTVPTLHIRADTAGSIAAFCPGVGMSGFICDAGIWLAGAQDAQVRASIRALYASNLTARDGDRQLGVFRLTADSLTGPKVENWPVEFGAPSDGDGRPRLIGDEMLWSAFLPRAGEIPHFRPQSLMASPLEGVVVSQSISGFRRDDLKDAVFIHFRILNRGVSEISDLHLGFYADIDLHDTGCVHIGNNSVGYDSLSRISYTYPSEALGDADLDCTVPVIGYSLLDAPFSAARLTYHVPLGKNWDLDDFSEVTLREPEDVLRRLRGLSSSGEPMVDPKTGRTTRFAFTGNPVDETGWLGIRSDVRSLLSTGDYTLSSGESLDITVVVVAKEASRLSESLSHLRRQFRTVEESGVLSLFRD